ncbi:hypothetical protein D9M69_454010 [compost metagenome]
MRLAHLAAAAFNVVLEELSQRASSVLNLLAPLGFGKQPLALSAIGLSLCFLLRQIGPDVTMLGGDLGQLPCLIPQLGQSEAS